MYDVEMILKTSKGSYKAMGHVEEVLPKAGDDFSFVGIQRHDCVNLCEGNGQAQCKCQVETWIGFSFLATSLFFESKDFPFQTTGPRWKTTGSPSWFTSTAET